MTPREAEKKLVESKKRRKGARGPAGLGFTIPEKLAVRILTRHRRTQAQIADMSGLTLNAYLDALKKDSELAAMQQLGRDDRLLEHAERLEKISRNDKHRGQMRALELLLKLDGQIGEARSRAHTEVNVNVNTLGQPQDPRTFASQLRKINADHRPVTIDHDTGRAEPEPILDPIASVKQKQREERDKARRP